MTWPAERYDAWFEQPWGRYAFRVETAAVMAALGPALDGRILDCGCGTGRLVSVLAARGSSPIGLDRDRNMLDVASRNSRAPLVQADAHALPLATASVGGVAAVALLEFVTDPATVLAEMCRVTRPGGRVVVGALNLKSPWGIAHRRALRRPPWTAARFLDRRQLKQLGDPHGPASVDATLFAPGPVPALARMSPWIEAVGALAPGLGAFQVLTVQRR